MKKTLFDYFSPPIYRSVDVQGKLVKVQVKAAWLDKKSRNYICDSRRTKTNRRVMIQEWAVPGETQVTIPVKFGEAVDVVIPSQAPEQGKV